MYVKYVISDVLSVSELLIIVLLARLEDIYIMVHVGIIAQVLWLTTHVLTNVQLDIGEFLINNVNHVIPNAELAIPIRLA